MKLRITNDSVYQTADLRALFRGAAKAVGATGPKHLRVRTRRGRITGHAILGLARGRREGVRVFLTIPQASTYSPDTTHSCLRDAVAAVMMHELMHSVGVQHRDMTREQLHCNMAVPWAADIPLREKTAKRIVRLSVADANERKARAALARAERRLQDLEAQLRRAEMHLRKCQQKVRYYDRKERL